MRQLNKVVLLGGIVTGLSCLPPSQTPITDEEVLGDNEGVQVSALTPEGSQCHTGTFECVDGSEVTTCGTWFFDVNEDDAIVGAGQITGGFLNAPISVTLSGAHDPTNPIIEITLSSIDEGTGVMHVSYVGPTLELVGNWSFTDAPEPEGTEAGGGVTGMSCTVIP